MLESFYEIKSQIDVLDSDPAPEQKSKIQQIRQDLGMSEELSANLSYYFSSEGLMDLALNPRPIPIEMRETEAKFEKLIARVDELFIALYKREQNKCDSFLTEIETAFDSTNLRIIILNNIYDEGCDLYARHFS